MFGTAVYLVDVNGNVISTIPVAGATTISGPLGRQADAASVSVALSTEDMARLPAALGQGTMAQGLKVVLPTDQSAIPINLQPTTSGGSTPYHNLDLGVTGQVVKNGVGQVYNYYIYNNANATRYVKWYDKGTAPTQADTPVWTFGIPAGAAANVAFPNGIAFAVGISLRGTTGVADNDTGAPAANDLVVNIGYK